jgi:hypothetical protein
MNDKSVPITIDDMKQLADFKFTRCHYFTVECDMPSSGWMLEFAGRGIPLLMTGGSGIILKPSPDEPLFTSADQIDSLFDAIEEDPQFSIGTGDVWIPNELVKPILNQWKLEPRGVTFRIGYNLFIAAMEFRTDRIDRKRFGEIVRELQQAVSFSTEEHEAFKAWRDMQVNLARQQYPKNKDLELSYRNSSDASDGKEVQSDE